MTPSPATVRRVDRQRVAEWCWRGALVLIASVLIWRIVAVQSAVEHIDDVLNLKYKVVPR